MSQKPVNFFWFRRDLRLHDNHGLYKALKAGLPVQCVFIFDTDILDKLEDKKDARLVFIHDQLELINSQLSKEAASLLTIYDTPGAAWKKWASEFQINAVYTNNDYEPYARKRDDTIREFLVSKNIAFHSLKDHVIFEKKEVSKDDGTPYTVFTPYKNRYLKELNADHYKTYHSKKHLHALYKIKPLKIVSLAEMGFIPHNIDFPGKSVEPDILKNYKEHRDFPSQNGTSRLSIHLRFGTISIRELVAKAIKHNSTTWLNELIWRDFYQMILWNFPYVAEGAFKPLYNTIPWRNDEKEFALWCEGLTGYPIVDAGMRELNATGFMHNRVRMITASFLVKHLLIDWQWGEAYFAKKLLDFDLASNNGGWQWAASSGCDAAPYFRIFNPSEQTRKFDPEYNYIRKWVPEFEDFSYPAPIVEHKFARERCLMVYASAIKKI